MNQAPSGSRSHWKTTRSIPSKTRSQALGRQRHEQGLSQLPRMRRCQTCLDHPSEPTGIVAISAQGDYFHVSLARGLFRGSAEALNLSEQEVIQQFVVPWKAGLQITLGGKAFEPGSAKLTIYAGPRVTTNQRFLGQGWLNATKFGEEVTEALLGRETEGLATPVSPSADAPDPRLVVVAHGRDEQARQAVFAFLRALELQPLEWGEMVKRTHQASPYTGDVVELAFRQAKAAVVLFTPDKEARLHPDLWGAEEEDHEKNFGERPRPNVILEAGMALMSHPKETTILEIGRVQPISNLAGRNVIRITNAGEIAPKLNDLASRLAEAGCPVNTSGQDWLDTKRFGELPALRRRARPSRDSPSSGSSTTNEVSEHRLADQIVQELRLLAEVASTDLLDRDDDPTPAEVREWADRAEVTIRDLCGTSYAALFRGKGRGLSPRDEVSSKITYVFDDLVPKAQGNLFR